MQGKAYRHRGNPSQAGHQSAAAPAKFPASLDEHGPAADADARHGAKPESSSIPAGIWRSANATTDASPCNGDATAIDATAPKQHANGKPTNEHATNVPKSSSPDASTTFYTRGERDYQSHSIAAGPKHAQRSNGRHSKQHAEHSPRASANASGAKHGPHRLLFPQSGCEEVRGAKSEDERSAYESIHWTSKQCAHASTSPAGLAELGAPAGSTGYRADVRSELCWKCGSDTRSAAAGCDALARSWSCRRSRKQ